MEFENRLWISAAESEMEANKKVATASDHIMNYRGLATPKLKNIKGEIVILNWGFTLYIFESIYSIF